MTGRTLARVCVTRRSDRGRPAVSGNRPGKRHEQGAAWAGDDRAGRPQRRAPRRPCRPRRALRAPLPGPVPVRMRCAMCARLPSEGRAGPGWSGRISPSARRGCRVRRHRSCRRGDGDVRLRRGLGRHAHRRGIGHDGRRRPRDGRDRCGSRRSRRSRRGHRGHRGCRRRGRHRRRRHLGERRGDGGLRRSGNHGVQLAERARHRVRGFGVRGGDQKQGQKRQRDRPEPPPKLCNQMISHDQVLGLMCPKNPDSIPEKLGIPCYLWYFHGGIGRKGRRRLGWECSCRARDSAAR